VGDGVVRKETSKPQLDDASSNRSSFPNTDLPSLTL